MIDGSAFRKELLDLSNQLYQDASNAMLDAVVAAENAAKITSLFQDRTGKLRSKIDGSASTTSTSISGKVVANTKYALYVEEGQPRHRITPKNAKALRFVWNGEVIYRSSVDHPGAAPRPFMANAQKWGGQVLSRQLESYIGSSIRRFNGNS